MNVSNISNAAAPATGWVRRVAGGGAVGWVVLGLVTAFLDPRIQGAGLIGLLGGFGAWLAAGVGLIATALAAIAAYRCRGPAVGLLAGLACLALAVVALIVADWNALLEGVVTVVGVVGLVWLWFRTRNVADVSNAESESSIGHPYSVDYVANVDHDLAAELGWPKTHQIMANDDD